MFFVFLGVRSIYSHQSGIILSFSCYKQVQNFCFIGPINLGLFNLLSWRWGHDHEVLLSEWQDYLRNDMLFLVHYIRVHVMLTCFIPGDGNHGDLVILVSARFLYIKITLFLFEVNVFWRTKLRLYHCSLSHWTSTHYL